MLDLILGILAFSSILLPVVRLVFVKEYLFRVDARLLIEDVLQELRLLLDEQTRVSQAALEQVVCDYHHFFIIRLSGSDLCSKVENLLLHMAVSLSLVAFDQFLQRVLPQIGELVQVVNEEVDHRALCSPTISTHFLYHLHALFYHTLGMVGGLLQQLLKSNHGLGSDQLIVGVQLLHEDLEHLLQVTVGSELLVGETLSKALDRIELDLLLRVLHLAQQ